MFCKLFCSRTPFGFKKITTDPHILADVNVQCPEGRYPKLKMRISELILDCYEYILKGFYFES
jgi:hypothetical protein